MTNKEIITAVQDKVSKGARFVSFTYRKSNGETSRRNVLLSVKIPEAQAKRGQALTGKGNWQTGNRLPIAHGAVIKTGKKYYLSGYEGGKQLKTYQFNGISNLI